MFHNYNVTFFLFLISLHFSYPFVSACFSLRCSTPTWPVSSVSLLSDWPTLSTCILLSPHLSFLITCLSPPFPLSVLCRDQPLFLVVFPCFWFCQLSPPAGPTSDFLSQPGSSSVFLLQLSFRPVLTFSRCSTLESKQWLSVYLFTFFISINFLCLK